MKSKFCSVEFCPRIDINVIIGKFFSWMASGRLIGLMVELAIIGTVILFGIAMNVVHG